MNGDFFAGLNYSLDHLMNWQVSVIAYLFVKTATIHIYGAGTIAVGAVVLKKKLMQQSGGIKKHDLSAFYDIL